jgi:protein gp37
MGYPTPIEWTDATWNPVGGCSIKSPGCINCYAQQLCGTRLARHPLYAGTTDIVNGRPVFNGRLTALPDDAEGWTWPLRWSGSKAPRRGPRRRSMVFVGDMSDLFHEKRPLRVIYRALGVMALADHLDFQLLTKRPEVMQEVLTGADTPGRIESVMLHMKPEGWPRRQLADVGDWPLRNVWCGTSAERQREADERRPPMARLHNAGWTTFVSYEPALGPVDWSGWHFLDWLISGGESGRHEPRPSHPGWHRATRDFCAARGIAYLFKQWGEWSPERSAQPDDLVDARREIIVSREGAKTSGLMAYGDNPFIMRRIGKGAAGRLLDGREHNAFPRVRTDPPSLTALAEAAR